MITKLLSAAIKLYLRSQVSHIEGLQVKISGKNSQILKGYIPQVFLSCSQGIYQGLHLKEVEVNGNNIAVNLSEVIKKKPLKLLEPVVVAIKVSLDSDDLSNSLDSELLQGGLTDLWKIILRTEQKSSVYPQIATDNIKWHNIEIANNRVSFSGTYQNNIGRQQNLFLDAELSLSNSHILCLFPLTISMDSDISSELDEELKIDLGKDIYIEKLIIESEQILCSGSITINS